MATEIRFRRGTSLQHASFTGALAEVTVDTDKKTLVVHDGSTAGGFPLTTPSDIAGKMATATYDPQGIADDAFDRANHTGSQAISTITGLQDELDDKADDAATTAALAAKADAAAVTAALALKDDSLQPYIDIASAGTTAIGGVASKNVRVTGTNGITSFGTAAAGTIRHVLFAAALIITHNGTSMILQNGGSNITTAAGDTGTFVSLGSGNWRQTSWTKAAAAMVLLQQVSSFTGAVATGTTVIPNDDTIPQITEGDQYLTVTITPQAAGNILEIDTQVVGAISTGAAIGMAVFLTGTADALKATQFNGTGAGVIQLGSLKHHYTATGTSAITFTVRAGPLSAATFTLNGAAGARKFGGVVNSYLVVKEYRP